MAGINALIAAGPHTRGLDVAGNMMKAQQLKQMQRQNQLADIQLAEYEANAPQRDLEKAIKLDTITQDLIKVAAFQTAAQTTPEAKAQVAGHFYDRYDTLDPRIRNMFKEAQTMYASGDEAQIAQADKAVQDVLSGFGTGEGSQKPPAQVETFNTFIGKLNNPDTPEIERQAAKVALGIDSRAKGPQVVDVGGVPYLWNPQTQALLQFGADGTPVTPETVATNKAEVAATVEGAKQAVVQSGKMFEMLAPVNKSIVNLNDAINAVDQGADTGAIMSRLPSVTEASVTLDNIRGQMGLDVIGATTFGALSEAELKFALDTAMPTGLDEPALRNWLVKKRDAQKKYAEELRKAAIYLGKPGNTVSGYLDSLEVNGLYSKGETGGDNATQPAYTEGTIAAHPDGRRVIFRNGKWEFLNE